MRTRYEPGLIAFADKALAVTTIQESGVNTSGLQQADVDLVFAAHSLLANGETIYAPYQLLSINTPGAWIRYGVYGRGGQEHFAIKCKGIMPEAGSGVLTPISETSVYYCDEGTGVGSVGQVEYTFRHTHSWSSKETSEPTLRTFSLDGYGHGSSLHRDWLRSGGAGLDYGNKLSSAEVPLSSTPEGVKRLSAALSEEGVHLDPALTRNGLRHILKYYTGAERVVAKQTAGLWLSEQITRWIGV